MEISVKLKVGTKVKNQIKDQKLVDLKLYNK